MKRIYLVSYSKAQSDYPQRFCTERWEFVQNVGSLYRTLGVCTELWEFVQNVGSLYRTLGVYTELWEFVQNFRSLYRTLGVCTEIWEFVHTIFVSASVSVPEPSVFPLSHLLVGMGRLVPGGRPR